MTREYIPTASSRKNCVTIGGCHTRNASPPSISSGYLLLWALGKAMEERVALTKEDDLEVMSGMVF